MGSALVGVARSLWEIFVKCLVQIMVAIGEGPYFPATGAASPAIDLGLGTREIIAEEIASAGFFWFDHVRYRDYNINGDCGTIWHFLLLCPRLCLSPHLCQP